MRIPGSLKTARRIPIIGGPGSGKSTLARELGTILHVPVYELDQIAFESKEFITRPPELRLAAVHAISADPVWITEGIFVGWVQELLDAAHRLKAKVNKRRTTRFAV